MPCYKDINGLGLTNLAEALIDIVRDLDEVTNQFRAFRAI